MVEREVCEESAFCDELRPVKSIPWRGDFANRGCYAGDKRFAKAENRRKLIDNLHLTERQHCGSSISTHSNASLCENRRETRKWFNGQTFVEAWFSVESLSC